MFMGGSKFRLFLCHHLGQLSKSFYIILNVLLWTHKVKNAFLRVPWVAQSVRVWLLIFSLGHDLWVVRLSPMSGSALSRESA